MDHLLIKFQVLNNFDFESETLKYDFRVPTDGYEMPYGLAYNIFIYSVSLTATNANLNSSHVNTVLQIASWIQTTGTGKFTYSAPAKLISDNVVEDNFDGAAFLKQAFYEVAGAGSDPNFCTTYFPTKGTVCSATPYNIQSQILLRQILLLFHISMLLLLLICLAFFEHWSQICIKTAQITTVIAITTQHLRRHHQQV